MLSWIAFRIIRPAIDRLNAGDIRPLLRMFRKDAVLRFPGESSWGREYRGRAEIEGFLRRFADTGLHLDPVEMVVKGPPWNMTACVFFTDHLTTAQGETPYRNRGVLYIKLRWGKVVEQWDFLDTQRVAALDEWLAARERPAS
jgi:ketosteroid isomerase-like protein